MVLPDVERRPHEKWTAGIFGKDDGDIYPAQQSPTRQSVSLPPIAIVILVDHFCECIFSRGFLRPTRAAVVGNCCKRERERGSAICSAAVGAAFPVLFLDVIDGESLSVAREKSRVC